MNTNHTPNAANLVTTTNLVIDNLDEFAASVYTCATTADYAVSNLVIDNLDEFAASVYTCATTADYVLGAR